MKRLPTHTGIIDADSGDDATTSSQLLQDRLSDVQQRMAALPLSARKERMPLQIAAARLMLDLERDDEAFDGARTAFDTAIEYEDWESAVDACDAMFLAERDESLAALGQGIWLAVTFPIDPELTVALLQHVVEETPPESDGAAIAATVAHYIADLRATGKQRDELTLFTNNLLATVARRHSKVESQEQFAFWFNKLELNDPAKFLPRLRNIVDVMVQDEWWLDRDAIWAKLPVH